MVYRSYVCNSLQLVVQNKYIAKTYEEIIHTKVDERTGEEVALDFLRRHDLKIGGKQ